LSVVRCTLRSTRSATDDGPRTTDSNLLLPMANLRPHSPFLATELASALACSFGTQGILRVKDW
jgi:hypothetical protein